jgi:Tol biopolymer transport system component
MAATRARFTPTAGTHLVAGRRKNHVCHRVPGYGIQLATINLDGSGFQRISNLPDLRGRNDWSNDGRWLVTYSGKPWRRELFMMNPDGSSPFRFPRREATVRARLFPDGGWITFHGLF